MNIKVFALTSIGITLLLFVVSQNESLKPAEDESKTSIKEATRIASECRGDKYYENCYEQKLSEAAQKENLFFVTKVLRELWVIDERTRACHAIAHGVAFLYTEKNPSFWKKFLGVIDPQECSGGFYHGILEGYSSFDSSFTVNPREIEKICSNKNNTYSEGSCLHVMGHLLFVDSYPDIDRAIKVCSQISLPSFEQCYSGVFMENMTKGNLKEHGLAEQSNWTRASLKNFEQVCLQYEGDAAKACWGEMGHMYAAVFNDSPNDTFQTCNHVPKAQFAENCYAHAIGKIAVTGDTQTKVNMLCNPYEVASEQFNNCMYRVIDALLKTSPKFFERARIFCSQLPKVTQATCQDALNKKFFMGQ